MLVSLTREGERGCFFAPVPEKEIRDFMAHGSIIRVLTIIMTPVDTSHRHSFRVTEVGQTSHKFLPFSYLARHSLNIWAAVVGQVQENPH